MTSAGRQPLCPRSCSCTTPCSAGRTSRRQTQRRAFCAHWPICRANPLTRVRKMEWLPWKASLRTILIGRARLLRVEVATRGGMSRLEATAFCDKAGRPGEPHRGQPSSPLRRWISAQGRPSPPYAPNGPLRYGCWLDGIGGHLRGQSLRRRRRANGTTADAQHVGTGGPGSPRVEAFRQVQN